MNKEELQKHLKDKGVQLIVGAYGEESGCEGLVEERDIQIDGKGNYTKLVGCSYLFKGFPDGTVIEDLRIPKKILSLAVIRADRWWAKLVLGFLFFCPRRLTEKHIIDIMSCYHQIVCNVVEKHLLPSNKYCPAVREIDRALTLVIDEFFSGKLRELFHFVIRNVGCMILEEDAAYKWRAQEFFSLIDKKKLKENPMQELKRAFTIYAHREKAMPEKIRGIKKGFIALRFNRFLKDFIVRFILELDLEKVKLDEADWYFCLLKNSYDFGGISAEERKKEKARIDKEKGHNIPKIVYKEAPPSAPVAVNLKPLEPKPKKDEKNK